MSDTERLIDLERRIAAIEERGTVFPASRCEPEVLAMKAKELVAVRFGMTMGTIEGRSRTPEVAWARQCAMHLARRFTGLSTPRIGRMFDRDHGTVLWACRTVKEMMATDQAKRRQVWALEDEFEDIVGGRKPKAEIRSPKSWRTATVRNPNADLRSANSGLSGRHV